jgi:hypothetical protein
LTTYLLCLIDVFFNRQSAYISLLLKKIEKKLARSFNFTFRHIDDVLSLNNSRFGDFVDRIYSIELDIRIPQLQIGLLHTLTYTSELYNKRYDFNFPIVNFTLIYSNIPAAPAYGVYLSQLIRYSKACGSYQDFLDRRCC